VILVGIGVCSVFATWSIDKTQTILSRRAQCIAEYLQVPLLYIVDVVWFEDGHPGVFEVGGATLLFGVLF